MEKANLEQLESFITADGSAIRELAGPAWSPVRNQSLAEATLQPGGETAEHYHAKTEELPGTRHKLWNIGSGALVLLCCCVPAYSDADTVLTGG